MLTFNAPKKLLCVRFTVLFGLAVLPLSGAALANPVGSWAVPTSLMVCNDKGVDPQYVPHDFEVKIVEGTGQTEEKDFNVPEGSECSQRINFNAPPDWTYQLMWDTHSAEGHDNVNDAYLGPYSHHPNIIMTVTRCVANQGPGIDCHGKVS